MLKNYVRNKKKKMSYLKVSDPVKRNLIVKKYLELNKNIQDNMLSERTGEQQLQTDLSKIFKPITETQKATAREITEEFKPIKEGIEAITFPAYPSIQASEEPLEGENTQFIGEVAEKYLRKFAAKDEADETYGLYDRHGNFYIGNKLAIIVDNDLVVGKDEYEGTPGLWELIVSKEPKDFTDDNYDNYSKLMIKTNAFYRDNNPENKRPKSSKSYKWNNISKTIWKNRETYEGSGVVFISSDPNALLEQVDLLLASQEAGHTGVINELVSICDELKRQGVLNLESYKKLISNIKKNL